jgi:hypothetical protein
MTYTVYALVDEREPEIVRYIGFSKDPSNRLKAHLSGVRHSKGHSHKLGWMRKVLSDQARILWRTLTVVDSDTAAAQAEIAAIRDHLEMGHPLTNGTEGGEGADGWGGVLTPEARAKSVAFQRTKENRAARAETSSRYWSTEETRDHQREQMEAFWRSPEGEALRVQNSEFTKAQVQDPSYLGGPRTPEARAKMRAAKLGKPGVPRTAEWRAKLSASQKGKTRRPWTDEERARHAAAVTPETRAKMAASAKARRRS